MALYFNLPVYKDSYDLLILIFRMVSKVPREYKHTLGERLKDASTDVLLLIFEASKAKENTKIENIENALSSLEKCRLYIRIFKDLNVCGIEAQAILNQKIEIISKQLTQWSIFVARVQQ